MDKRTTGMIATIAATLVCGCPGFFALCMGLIMALASQVPGADIDIAGSSDPTTALITGIGTLCVGVVFIAIPIVVGVLMLRNKPAAEPMPNWDEPVPPAI
ncbi:MAG: hypothetical protein AB1894_14575 [Chloroflexota bacterium]